MSEKYILFLDFDGVTHPVSGGGTFRKECLEALNIAILELNLEIGVVISSSWSETYDLESLKNYLGNSLSKYVIGKIRYYISDPYLKYPRFHLVGQWLSENGMIDAEWIAIDDELGNYPSENAYFTNRRTGFASKDIKPFVEMVKAKFIMK